MTITVVKKKLSAKNHKNYTCKPAVNTRSPNLKYWDNNSHSLALSDSTIRPFILCF